MALRIHAAVAWVERQNSGAVSSGGRFIRSGWRGCSDMLGNVKGWPIPGLRSQGTERGRISQEQQVFLDRVAAVGGIAFLARDYADFQQGATVN